MTELKPGDYVRHMKCIDWGFGVVEGLGENARVYLLFENQGRVTLNQKVVGEALELLEDEDIPEDSNLRDPGQWKDIARVKTARRSLDGMIQTFLEMYPCGFKDPAFDGDERAYKLEGAVKARALLEPKELAELLTAGHFEKLHSRACKAAGTTNTIFPQEKMKLKDVPPDAFPEFAECLVALVTAPDQQVPERIEDLARVLDPHDAAKWTTTTYLAQVFDLDTRIFVKPTAVAAAAAALEFDIEYKPLPNARTYRRIHQLYGEVDAGIKAANLVPRDYLDVSTFLWVGSGLGKKNVARRKAAGLE